MLIIAKLDFDFYIIRRRHLNEVFLNFQFKNQQIVETLGKSAAIYTKVDQLVWIISPL